MDYCSHCTIELWEKSTGSGQKDFSIRLSISEGAHSPAVLDSNVDAVRSPPPSNLSGFGGFSGSSFLLMACTETQFDSPAEEEA